MPLTNAQSRHNLAVVKRALGIDNNVSLTDAECLSVMQELGEFVMQWISDKTYTYEDDTYNLTDSTGCAIYKKGVLTEFKYYPAEQATRPRVFYKNGRKTFIDGRALLERALSRDGLQLAASSSYSLQVFSAAPYGVYVNYGGGKRGTGWFDSLKADTESKFREIISRKRKRK